jgi:hypothetical protein
MNHEKAQAVHQQPTSPAVAPLVRIDVCGAENIVTLVSRRDSQMQDSYTFAGLSQQVTVSLLPETRVFIDMTGADNRVLVSKELTVVAAESTGAGNRLEYFTDETD